MPQCRALKFAVMVLLLSACEQQVPDRRIATRTDESTPAGDLSTDPASNTGAGEVSLDRAPTLQLDGLADLSVGQAIRPGSSFSVRGAKINSDCKIASSPDYPNVYAILVKDKVRRITVTRGSRVTLQEGIGPEAELADVEAAFPGFRETPHKYWVGGKIITEPGDQPRLMLEIDPNGTVANMHVGLMPELTYAEGCA